MSVAFVFLLFLFLLVLLDVLASMVDPCFVPVVTAGRPRRRAASLFRFLLSWRLVSEFLLQPHLAALGNLDVPSRLVSLISGSPFHSVYDRLSSLHPAEGDMLAVEVGRRRERYEELRAVRIWSAVGHGQQVLLRVFDLETLITELLSVDAFSTSAVAFREIAALRHESGDNAMK